MCYPVFVNLLNRQAAMSSPLPEQVPCPICRKKVQKGQGPHYPFCSERCQLVDLGRWLKEGYRIEGDEPLSSSIGGEGAED